MTQSNKAVSPLRQRMLDDMRIRDLSPGTQKGYIRAVKRFADYFGRSPDKATAEDLRLFQLHMVNEGASSGTLNATVSGLRFFFEVTLSEPSTLKKITYINKPRKLPVVLSQEEMAQLINAAGNLKHKAALSVAYGAGLRASEVVGLKISDIDSERMILLCYRVAVSYVGQNPTLERFGRNLFTLTIKIYLQQRRILFVLANLSWWNSIHIFQQKTQKFIHLIFGAIFSCSMYMVTNVGQSI